MNDTMILINSNNVFNLNLLFNNELKRYMRCRDVDDGIVCDFIMQNEEASIFLSLHNSRNKVTIFDKVYFIVSLTRGYADKDTQYFSDVYMKEIK